MHIRSYEEDDFEAVSTLWEHAEHLGGVSRDDVDRKLRRDRQLFLVAEDVGPGAGAGGAGDGPGLVGVVMGSTDGRRGHVSRLAVHPRRRHEGIGAALVHELERRFLAIGIDRVNLLVLSENAAGRRFWERLGYQGFEGVVLHSRRLGDGGHAPCEDDGPPC